MLYANITKQHIHRILFASIFANCFNTQKKRKCKTKSLRIEYSKPKLDTHRNMPRKSNKEKLVNIQLISCI